MPGQIFSLLLKEPKPNVPTISGLAATNAVKKTFASLQNGRVNRGEFSEEFDFACRHGVEREIALRIADDGSGVTPDLDSDRDAGKDGAGVIHKTAANLPGQAAIWRHEPR